MRLKLISYTSLRFVAVIIFLVLIEVKGVPLPYLDEPPRRHNSVPYHGAMDRHYKRQSSNHQQFSVPNQNFYPQQPPSNNNQPPQWHQHEDYHDNYNWEQRHREHEAYNDDYNWGQRHREHEAYSDDYNWEQRHREERFANQRLGRDSWRFGPGGIPQNFEDFSHYGPRQNLNGRQHYHRLRRDKYQEEENPHEFFHHHNHIDTDTRNYKRPRPRPPPSGMRSFNGGLRDLDGFDQTLLRKETSQFPDPSVAKFRSSSISLGNNLEIVRIELDISDGEENEETTLEEVEDQ